MEEKMYRLRIIDRSHRDLRRSFVKQSRIALHRLDTGTAFFSSSPIRGGKAHEIEEELYLGAFLAIDPQEVEQLLAFQQKYGQIASCLRVMKNSVPHPNYNVEQFSFRLLNDESRGIEESAKLVGLEINHVTSSLMSGEPAQPRYGLGLVSLSEVMACVEDAQQIIRNLTKFANDGWKSDDVHEFKFLELQMQYVTHVVNSYFPPFEACSKVEMETVPLMAAIYGQLLNGLIDGETFKECGQCHRLFQYKAATVDPATGAVSKRRKGAKYCSPECQRSRYHHKKNADGSYQY